MSKTLKPVPTKQQQKKWLEAIAEMDAFYAEFRAYFAKCTEARQSVLLLANPTFAALRKAAGA